MREYLSEIIRIAEQIKEADIDEAISLLRSLRARQGRLFILGNGGSAANASHAVNDFRKIAGIEAYAPTDNVSELTAWVNDRGWTFTPVSYLSTSHLNRNDAVMLLSVGGGSEETSANLVRALKYAADHKAQIISIVSRDGGYAKEHSNVCILIPVVNEKHVTPHAESWQAIIWHLLAIALEDN